MRSFFVVKVAVACWMPNRSQKTPEQQNSPMMAPLLQGYNAPPNDKAMIPEQRAPAKDRQPTISMRRVRAQILVGELSILRDGRMNTNTGRVTPTRIRLK